MTRAVAIFDEIDSTNEEARRRAAAGETGPLWILAHRQTAGRGRRGRAWDSPTGNLMTTLLVRPRVSPAEGARLSFVAALAVSDAIAAWLPGAHAELKWPNDVLVSGKKIAGILLESAAAPGGHLDWVAVGIGVNLKRHPDDTPYPATSIAAEGGEAPAPEAALVALGDAWDAWFARWAAHGFAPIRSAWLDRAKGRGERLTVRLPNESFDGVFEDLDDTGALVLRLDTGLTRKVSAGEVFFASAP